MRSGARTAGEGVGASGPREIRDLGSTIDALALDLDRRITQLEAASIEVQSAAATRDRFLANLGHELRTPLNAIIGFAGTMKMELAGPLTDEQRAQLEMIYGSGKHLLALVERLLEYSIIEAGVDRVDATRFSPCKVVVDVVRLFELVAAEKGIDLVAVECRCESEAYTDRFKVEQILINLVANAVKFTERGRVAVAVSQEGGCLRIDVEDTGTGIPAAHVESVFEKFTQLQTERAVKPEGTGLGLTIAREYARLLGGDITVESVPGIGSTFTLHLPLEYDERTYARPAEGCPAE
jgi:signal transduction histidine kinase